MLEVDLRDVVIKGAAGNYKNREQISTAPSTRGVVRKSMKTELNESQNKLSL